MSYFRRSIDITLGCVALLFATVEAHARRVALVIGNSAYNSAPVLANPRNDAADMAAVLGELGFEVIAGLDLDKMQMDRSIRTFADKLSGAELAAFFYAGHGLQVAGVNYLVPIDAQLSSAGALDFEAVRVDLVQKSMERETKTNVMFLDACRDNPLARNLARSLGTRSAEVGRGLAKAEAGSGTLISFSTQPGNVALDGTGRNSPFTGPLVTHLRTSQADLSGLLIDVRNDVMAATAQRQVPWENSALTARVYFRGGVGAAVSPAPRSTITPAREGIAAEAPRCSALAVSSNNKRGTAVADSIQRAENLALEACASAGGANCKISSKVCN